ncbi:MAG: Qat anti-phage system QueC-like protein QatC [Natronincolaceae bacterium]
MINIVYKNSSDEDYAINGNYITYNFNDYKYTFWKSKLELLPKFPSIEAIDLLMISLAVYGADKTIERKVALDGWKRSIHLHLPVLNLDSMNRCKELLKQTTNFLTGDIWEFTFRQRELSFEEINIKEQMDQIRMNTIDTDKLCMLSGGLDSFIGAIDLLEVEESHNIIFISHYGGGKGTIKYQKALKKKLINKYSILEENFYSFYAAPPGGIEKTTRSRSFMFFSHAVAIASCLDKNIDLFIPENGYISLNIPLTYSRIGSSSTRTTHPHYMYLFQELINKLQLKVTLINPYQFKTKGEMIFECRNKQFLINNISNTMSCSHPDVGRMQGESEPRHCGTCLPCVIRRAAIKFAGIKDETIYHDLNFLSGPTARKNLNSYLLGIEKFDDERAFLYVQMSGPLDSNILEYESLLKRGIIEMKEVLKDYYGDY